MSSKQSPWVVATITAFIMTLASLVSAPATHAAPGDPIIPTAPTCVVTLVSGDPATAPPAPTCYDPSGSDLDEFLVPLFYDSGGRQVIYQDAAWSPFKWDQPNSTKGASLVSVQTQRYDSSSGGYVGDHAWSLSFNTAVTGAPAANNYWVTVGECLGRLGVRRVTAFFKNEVGQSADGRYIGYVYPSASAKGVSSLLDTQPIYRVYDGATVAMPLIYDEEMGAGVLSGYVYTVDFWLEDRSTLPNSGGGTRRLGASVTVDVPACSLGPSDPGDDGSATVVEPRAKIKVVKRGPVFSKVKVVLGSRKATVPTKYKVIRDPKHGRTLKKVYNTKFKVVKYHKVRKGTVVKVRFKTKVLKRRV